MRIVDLRDLGLPERKTICERFYARLYVPAFPEPDTAESPETWLPLLASGPPIKPPHPILHLWIALDGSGGLMGGLIGEYFRGSNTGLFTYLVIDPALRGRGLAHALLHKGLGAFATDSQEGGARGAPVSFCETYDPGKQPPGGERTAGLTRVSVLYALGFQALDFPYVQPALAPGLTPVDDLLFMVHRTSTGSASSDLSRDRLLQFMGEFYQSLGWSDPHTSQDFQAMESWLNSRARIEFLEPSDIERRGR